MLKIITITITLLTYFTINCSSAISNEKKRPLGVSENAVWLEDQKRWGVRLDDETAIFWYQNGNKAKIVKIIDGKQNGLFISWHENGNKEMEGMCRNDLLEGLWKTWWSNGQLKTIGNYINDKFDGLWKGYDEEGNLIQEAVYKNGELISIKKYNKK